MKNQISLLLKEVVKQKLFIVLLMSLSLGVFFSCEKEDDGIAINYEATGVLVGVNISSSTCYYGRYIVTIDGVSGNYYAPNQPNRNLDVSTLPLDIELNWTEYPENDCPRIISIESIESTE